MTTYNLQPGFNAFPVALGAPGSHIIEITNNGPAICFPSFRPIPVGAGSWTNELQVLGQLAVGASITQPVTADASGNYLLCCGTAGDVGSIGVTVLS